MSADLEDPEVTVLIAFVAGLFALLGALAGAFLARRTEYIKWLRQNRSETFADFLGKLFEAQAQAITVLHDQSLEPLRRDIRVTEIYSVPENYARVVRLYLPKSHREEFSALIREIRALHASVSLGDSRLLRMEQKIERVQSIFEGAVASYKRMHRTRASWLRPLARAGDARRYAASDARSIRRAMVAIGNSGR